MKMVTKAGRVHVLTQQVVGLVHRATPLLIIGQKGCMLCGYRTIEQQDADQAKAEKKLKNKTNYQK